MMLSLIIAFGIIIIFFSIGAFLRYGEVAKMVSTSEKDKSSTSLLGIVYFLNFIILLSGFILNHYEIGILFNISFIAFLGNFMMIMGLIIRINATKTLKQYYTKSLRIQTSQQLVDFGLYKYIRHPGYLGSVLLWAGAGLSSNNYLLTIIILIITFLAYHYRIINEEKMLIDAFGEEYNNYKKRTWKMVPWIY